MALRRASSAAHTASAATDSACQRNNARLGPTKLNGAKSGDQRNVHVGADGCGRQMRQKLVRRFVESRAGKRAGIGRRVKLLSASGRGEMAGDVEGHDEVGFFESLALGKQVAVD